jgi:transmembrane sensor
MDYEDYSATDFADDHFFIGWVRNPDRESDFFWTAFLEKNPHCRSAIDDAREMISSLDFHTHELKEKEFDRMRNRLLGSLQAAKANAHELRDVPGVIPMRARSKGIWMRRIAAASIIIPLFSAGVLLLTQNFDRSNKYTGVLNADEMERKISPSGEKSMLFLTDGTRIWLNGNSKLSYARDFQTKNTRDVYLEGEAFFDVAHDARKPFVVHTSTIRIKVLGTSFNVKSYSEEETIETTLVHGKVSIEQSDEKGNRIGGIELAPNQRAIFNKESRLINIKQVGKENTGSWRQERLVFEEERMSSVIEQMEKWYQVKIHVEGSRQLDCKLTASIGTETLEEFLKLMELTHGIGYTVSGKDVFITGTLCK